MDNNVIKVKDLHKSFKLPTEKVNSVKSIFTNFGSFRKKTYETQKALRGVSFEVKEGEFFGIVGRNGSGKSTLLKILAGIYQPSKGSITTKGKVVPFIELGVGFNPELTGRENVFLNGAMLGFNEKEVLKKYEEIVDFAELHKHMNQKLKNYSSGMQVRLAFSVATILAESDILLLDEVLAVGDAEFQRKCFNYFKTLKKNNKTVIFVSHDMNSVREYCDKAVLIEKGKIIAYGSSTSVANEYTKLFIANNDSNTIRSNNNNRTGSGAAFIEDYKQSIILKSKEEDIEIKFKVCIKEDIDSLAIGFRLKSADDKHLFGTNNIIQNQKLEKLTKNQTLKVKFNIPNMLNNGTYQIDLAAESADGEIYDWIIDAITIECMFEKKTGYIIDPNVGMEILNVN
jgi:ABC-2 type transport system ATP-binding protein